MVIVYIFFNHNNDIIGCHVGNELTLKTFLEENKDSSCILKIDEYQPDELRLYP